MSITNPTLDDVWRLFQETDRILKEKSLETDRLIKEGRQETERRFQETERRSQEAERLFKEQRQEAERLSRETERKIDKVNEAIGKLGNRLGDFVEDAVRLAAVRLFQERGIDVWEVQQNVSVQRGNEGLELDLLVVNDEEAVAIECKSNLTVEDVKNHVQRLDKFKRLMPRYANYRVLGAVAAMVLGDEAARYAARQGFYVIGQSGEHLVIR